MASCFALAAGALAMARYRRRQLRLICARAATPIRDLRPGPVAIEGRIRSRESPLVAPVSRRPCLYYEFVVLHDPGGEESSETVVRDQRTLPCLIDDGTGQIDVDWGSVSLTLEYTPDLVVRGDFKRDRQLLHRIEESYKMLGRLTRDSYREVCLPLDWPVFAIGWARQVGSRWKLIAGEGSSFVTDGTRDKVIRWWGDAVIRWQSWAGLLAFVGVAALAGPWAFLVSLFISFFILVCMYRGT